MLTLIGLLANPNLENPIATMRNPEEVDNYLLDLEVIAADPTLSTEEKKEKQRERTLIHVQRLPQLASKVRN